jgi:hypothetical protein
VYAPLPAIHFSIPYSFHSQCAETITMQQPEKSKKQNYLHPFTGIRNQNNQSTSPRPNPDIKPRHDLAVSESKTDRNPVYVGQNRFRDPRKIINQAKHRFPASAIPIASHGRRSSLKTETRPPLTFSSQMNNPDTPSPRNEDAARVCHR